MTSESEMDHETLVWEFQKFQASANCRLNALEKGAPVVITQTCADLLLLSIDIQPEPQTVESISFEQHNGSCKIPKTIQFSEPSLIRTSVQRTLIK